MYFSAKAFILINLLNKNLLQVPAAYYGFYSVLGIPNPEYRTICLFRISSVSRRKQCGIAPIRPWFSYGHRYF